MTLELGIRWSQYVDAIAERLSRMSPAEMYRFWAVHYIDIIYHRDKENFIEQSDCSGTVCGPLWMMGYNIRTHADRLFRELFTERVTDFESPDDIMAVFYETPREQRHLDRNVGPGYITHVAPVVGRYVLVNAVDPIRLEPSASVYHNFHDRGFAVHWRKINWQLLEEHSKKRDMCDRVDKKLTELYPH